MKQLLKGKESPKRKAMGTRKLISTLTHLSRAVPNLIRGWGVGERCNTVESSLWEEKKPEQSLTAVFLRPVN